MTWRRVVLGSGLLLVVTFGLGGWWCYEWWQPNQIRIRNDSAAEVYVYGDPVDLCPGVAIAPGTEDIYEDDLPLCRKPRLRFESLLFETLACEWDVARDAQPVVFSGTTVSCYTGPPLIPYSPPVSSTPVSSPRSP